MRKLLTLLIVSALPLMAGELKPNFVLMMTDDQGWGSITERSEIIKTPGLDTLIAHGIHFNRFYSGSSVCSPTRAAFLTGRNPLRTGVPDANRGHLKLDETTIAHLAKMAGYATGHYGKWHVGTLTKLRNDGNRGKKYPNDYAPPWIFGYDRSFVTESKVPTYNPMIKTSSFPFTQEKGGFYGTYYWTEPEDLAALEGVPVPFDSLKGDDAKLIVDRALRLIDSSIDAKVPFLTTLWFHTPHAPIVVPKDTANSYYPKVSTAKWRSYYTSIEMMSNQVLRVYKHLEAKGVLDNTFMLFTSDNGGAHTQGVAPHEAVNVLRGGKTHFYEGGIRVPGMIVWPDRIPKNVVTEFPATVSDIYPTLKAILGLTVENQKPIDGINLLPVIDALVAGQEDLKRLKPIGFLRNSNKAWIDGDKKIVNMGKGWETFDLSGDISEKSDLTKTNAAMSDSMQNAFKTWETLVDEDKPFDFEKETNALPVNSAFSVRWERPGIMDFSRAHTDIFNASGRRIGSFVNQSPKLRWNGYVGDRKMAEGIYLLRAVKNNQSHAVKVLVR